MALPRRCKHCRCFTAPWLKRCPRCNKVVPNAVVSVKPTKEEKAAERAKLDVGVPVIHQSKMQWVPSALALASHATLLDEAKRKLERAESARERNVLRSEIRSIKSVLNKTADKKFRWSTEIFRGKDASIQVFISPKGRKYVTAPVDSVPDLLIKNKKTANMPFGRLQLFEKSKYFKLKRAEQKEEKVHAKRKKVKKERRLKKRKHTHPE